jgi:hypothetical protein
MRKSRGRCNALRSWIGRIACVGFITELLAITWPPCLKSAGTQALDRLSVFVAFVRFARWAVIDSLCTLNNRKANQFRIAKRRGMRGFRDDNLWLKKHAVGQWITVFTVFVRVPVVNQIRTYWWCNPPKIGRQRMCPAR